MKIMERNKRPLWYLLYDRKAPAVDAKGNETGEEIIVYKPAVALRANVSPRIRVLSGRAVRQPRRV